MQWLALLITMQKNASEEVTLSTFEAIFTESNFQNYANKHVAISQTLPHDADGEDHDSVGPLQQRVGIDGSNQYGWGDVYQAMDINHSISVYVDRAMQSGMQGKGAHAVAQSVQRSMCQGSSIDGKHCDDEYGGNYKRKQDDAIKLINKLREKCAEIATKGQP